ncbi:PH-like domain-containing protein [Schumannella luteola]
MSREFLLALVLVLLVVLLALLPLGWFARRRRQRSVTAPAAVPASLGESRGAFRGKYVATTASGDPYDRIAVHGLGFRSNVEVTVTDAGLLLARPGESDTWIPREDLRSLDRATWTIDRVVEPDGLQLVEWMLGSRPVATYLRLDDPTGFDAALTPLFPTTERQAS